jgi:ABC-type transport system substrate-binding protein
MGEARFRRAPVGTGPFRLERWTRAGLRLVANPDYFRGRPHLDHVEIGFFDASEADHGTKRFHHGKIDVLEVPPDEIDRLASDPGVRLSRHPEMSLTFLGFDTTRRPLDDPRVRQAVTHAIDREAIVETLTPLHRLAAGIVPPGFTGYVPGAHVLAHDPGLARRLLARAGYPGGRGLPPLDVYAAATSPTARFVLGRIETDLGAVGIQVRARPVSWSELNARLNERKAPAFVLSWMADLADPDAFLRPLFQSGGPAAFFGLEDAGVEQGLASGAREVDLARRAKVYAHLEQRLLHLAPLVPLFHTVNVLAVRPEVRGLEPGPMGLANAALQRVWLSAPGPTS